jgi:hypothetical protein
VKPIVDELLADAMMLSKHPYASYVMAQVFEQGTDAHQNIFMEALIANAVTLGSDGWACGVVLQALVHGDSESCLKLASALLKEQGLVVRMARSRRGHLAVRIILDLFEEAALNGLTFAPNYEPRKRLCAVQGMVAL